MKNKPKNDTMLANEALSFYKDFEKIVGYFSGKLCEKINDFSEDDRLRIVAMVIGKILSDCRCKLEELESWELKLLAPIVANRMYEMSNPLIAVMSGLSDLVTPLENVETFKEHVIFYVLQGPILDGGRI